MIGGRYSRWQPHDAQSSAAFLARIGPRGVGVGRVPGLRCWSDSAGVPHGAGRVLACGVTARGPAGRAPGAALILLAAGNGQRSGHATNKVLLPLAGRRVFTWSLDWTAPVREITHTVLVVRGSDRAAAAAVIAKESPRRDITIVSGGNERHDSEWAGLVAVSREIRAREVDVVVIHDAARPLAGSDLFRQVIAAAREHGGALPGRPVVGLLPRVSPNGTRTRADGAGTAPTVAVQTPQAFRAQPLLEAYEAAAREGFVGSDTASCIERFADIDIAYLQGEAHNIKITFPEDLFVAERLLARSGFALPRRGWRSR